MLESLETRQLLSFASVGLNPIVAQPSVGATPLLSSPYPSGPAPTTIFPVPFPNNIVVVVVSIGSSRLVVIVPITTTSHSLVASNSHPVQFETPSPVSLPAPTPSTLNSFGQLSTVDSLSWRTSRFGSEDEVAALIDVVEPFQAPVPAVAPNKAATPFRTGATVMLPAGGLPHLPRLDRGAEAPTVSVPICLARALPPRCFRKSVVKTSRRPRAQLHASPLLPRWPARATGLRSEISRAASLAGAFHDPIGH